MTEKHISAAEIVCLLDRSGSMTSRVEATIDGFNEFIKRQRDLGPGRLTLILFDDRYDIVYEDKALSTVLDLTRKVYFTRGSTALMDAIGKTIARVKERHLNDRPEQTLFMIITDGKENDSEEYIEEGMVKGMVNECIDDLEWEFFFLGVEMDAFAEAGEYGISRGQTVSVAGDHQGTQNAYAAVNQAMSMSRTGASMGDSGKTMSDLYDEQEDKESSGSGVAK